MSIVLRFAVISWSRLSPNVFINAILFEYEHGEIFYCNTLNSTNCQSRKHGTLGCSSIGRAPVFGTVGCRFESCHPSQPLPSLRIEITYGANMPRFRSFGLVVVWWRPRPERCRGQIRAVVSVCHFGGTSLVVLGIDLLQSAANCPRCSDHTAEKWFLIR